MNKNIDKLPEMCYGVLNTSNELIIIKRGESGYYRTNYPAAKTRKDTEEWCDELNERMDITKAQRKAMECGSMFGWDVPGADPDCYINKNI